MRSLLVPPLLATAAAAQQAPPAPVATPVAATPAPAPADDRRFGHFPYADVGAGALVAAPPGFALGQPCRVQPAVATALEALLAAHAASGVGGSLRGISCYRSIAHQRSVFCRKGRRCLDNEGRARLVAPPGYSEHETGYAIDFASRPAPGCPDVAICFAATPPGLWLTANAARFGFELSFPASSAQGVGWEPWHWRWVGVDGEEPAARAARAIFATARARFPAFPAVPPIVVRVAAQPPAPIVAAPPPPPPPPPPPAKRRRGLFGR